MFSPNLLFRSLAIICLVIAAGCSQQPVNSSPPATQAPADGQAATGSSFDTKKYYESDAEKYPAHPNGKPTPEEAIETWAAAVKENGRAGHLEFTVTDEAALPEDKWLAVYQEFEPAIQAGQFRVLKGITADPLALFFVERDGQLDQLYLVKDANGWHLATTLRTDAAIGWSRARQKAQVAMAGNDIVLREQLTKQLAGESAAP